MNHDEEWLRTEIYNADYVLYENMEITLIAATNYAIKLAKTYAEHQIKAEYQWMFERIAELESKLLKEKCTTRHLAIREVEREEQAVKQKKRIAELEALLTLHRCDITTPRGSK